MFLRFRDGDVSAFSGVIDRFHDDLLRFLYRLLGDRTAAEDVFQEAFLQVYHSAGTFDKDRRFRPWLFTIAANKGRDYLRKKGRRQEVELMAPIGGVGASDGGRGGTFVDLMEVDVPAPGAALDAREREVQVQRALAAMPYTLREILLLAYFQRLSYQQIADDLGIPLGTVKSRLHSAVATFADRWKKLTTTTPAPEKEGQDT